MRITIDLDCQLIEQALQLSKVKTKKEVVTMALVNFVDMLKRQQLLGLQGKVTWDDNLDC